MKWNMILGALVLSIGICSQSFGAGLIEKMLGAKSHGCCGGEPTCCEPTCCEPVCAEPACCEPACKEPACCEPACKEAVCCDPCQDACDPCCKKRHGLLRGLKGIFKHKRCCNKGCDTGCEPACCEPVCHEAACCEPVCHEAACCDDPCDPCCKKRCGFGGLLKKLFHHKRKCCVDNCVGGCGASPAPANGEEAAPMPPPPTAMRDHSASFNAGRRVIPAGHSIR